MLFRTTLRFGLCVVLLMVTSCLAADSDKAAAKPTVTIEKKAEISDVNSPKAALEPGVIVQLGDKKLTMEQIDWIRPTFGGQKLTGQQIAETAQWWLENELLSAEAEKRGIANQTKAKFLIDMMAKKVVSQELIQQVKEAVEINDKTALNFYNENKDDDVQLRKLGEIGFVHVQTKTIDEAKDVLKRIKAGEDISELAKKLSTHRDGKKGGVAKKYKYKTVERRFGKEFFDAVVAVKKGELVGPVKDKKGNYEVARQTYKSEPGVLPFEKVKEAIKTRLMRIEKEKSFTSLIDSLKKASAGKIVKSPKIVGFDSTIGRGNQPKKRRRQR